MSKIDDGGPAFPHSRLGSDCDGMTLRDYFAAKAMALKFGPTGSSLDVHDMAAQCYQMADAMLKARGAQS